jgi:hypothetical protein
MLVPKSVRLALFIALLFVFVRFSLTQSACIESFILNATVCYWDASNHSTIATPAIVGLTLLPLLHPSSALLYATLNGRTWIPLSSGAAAVPVPAVDASLSCDSECSGVATDGSRCCSLVIDVWLVTHGYRTNIGCSLYFTVPVHAAAAALPPVFKFHGEINAGLQVMPPPLSTSICIYNNSPLHHHLPNSFLSPLLSYS